jgi:DNA-directed RNA polymerase subunit RPC12/RpoP
MAIDKKEVKCGDCGLTIEEDSGIAVEDRLPCPTCGSFKRAFHVTIHDTCTIREKIGRKSRHAVEGKPFIEQVQGSDLHQKSGKWMNLVRIIDRGNDSYHEVVTNPETGEIIHECKEPLSQHVGHGTARNKESKKHSDSYPANPADGVVPPVILIY